MRVVIQRVNRATVTVDGQVSGEIGVGLLVFLGVHLHDSTDTVSWMVDKIINLRIFSDAEGKMNRSLLDCDGELLVVSQFTLYGDCTKGKRPSFTHAASPAKGNELYELFLLLAKEKIKHVGAGVFGAHMNVALENDGPVTMILEKNN